MTLLSKRMENDIWRNLYEFPLIETECAVTWGELSGMAVFQELFDGIEKVEITREYVAKKSRISCFMRLSNISLHLFTITF
mgnify:CR=1 FL=1